MRNIMFVRKHNFPVLTEALPNASEFLHATHTHPGLKFMDIYNTISLLLWPYMVHTYYRQPDTFPCLFYYSNMCLKFKSLTISYLFIPWEAFTTPKILLLNNRIITWQEIVIEDGGILWYFGKFTGEFLSTTPSLWRSCGTETSSEIF